MMSYDYPHPVSRSYQYKKITKPLLERKRRARINRCLEELKDLMVDVLETEGENISKLEKADILELTVRHLQRLQASRPSGLSVKRTDDVSENRWHSGFGHCAAEACRFLSTLPGEAAENLARYLAVGLRNNFESSTMKANSAGSAVTDANRTNVPTTCSPADTRIYANRAISYFDSTSKRYPNELQATKSSQVDMENREGRQGDVKRSSACLVNLEIKSKLEQTDKSKSKLEDSQRTVAEDDEEIDVEGVDDGDPMWRPW